MKNGRRDRFLKVWEKDKRQKTKNKRQKTKRKTKRKDKKKEEKRQKKGLPYRELNPGLSGESRVS